MPADDKTKPKLDWSFSVEKLGTALLFAMFAGVSSFLMLTGEVRSHATRIDVLEKENRILLNSIAEVKSDVKVTVEILRRIENRR